MKKIEIISGGGGYIVAMRALLCVGVVLAAFGVLCNIGGCGPGSTDSVGAEANVVSNNANGTVPPSIDPNVEPIDNTPPNNEPFEGNVVDGQICELPGVVLYDADGDAIECVPNSTLLQAFCNGEARFVRVEGYEQPQQVCEYEPPISDPTIEHAEQCTALTLGDGQWFREVGDALMEVTCQPKDGKCAVTFDGEGTSFTGTYLATELPVTGFWNDPDNGYEYILEFDVMDDGNRSVQRTILNGKLAGESFFRR